MKNASKLSKLRRLRCVICGKIFHKHIAPSEISVGRGKVCSMECKGKLNSINKRKGEFRECSKCGKEFWIRPSEIKKGRGKYCSRKCYQPVERGKAISVDNYYVISGKKVHRIIMESHIRRELLSSEIVHHINGNKLDNRIENLQIVSRSEHNKLHFKINDGKTNQERFYLNHPGYHTRKKRIRRQ